MIPPSQDIKKERLKDALLGLHWAAITGNVGLVKFALDHGVSIDSVVNGFVPLQLACINDSNIAVVQYLIDRGADVNIQKWPKKLSLDKSQAVQGAIGSTALHVACANGCIKIVDLLLRNQAHIDVKDKYGSTPLDIAHAKQETDIIQLLKSKPARTNKIRSNSFGNDEQNLEQKTIDRQENHRRLRRPSLPSILEHHPRFLNSPRRTLVETHGPPQEKKKIDWYSYGVVRSFEEEHYLLSLERRAYNMCSTTDEISPQESTPVDSIKDSRRASIGTFHPLETTLPDTFQSSKKRWFHDHSTPLVKRATPHDSSDDEQSNYKHGFFSRWTPAWSRKQ